jgi:hypothetical protein
MMLAKTIDVSRHLGWAARDRITGFEGVITGYCAYLTGCHQVLLVGPATDGKEGAHAWFDLQRVGVDVSRPPIALENGPTPGCDHPAPVR